VLDAVRFAWENQYASVVLQAGEQMHSGYLEEISEILRKIKEMTGGDLGITLSLGEQKEATLREWFELGATRYLLRIEVSNPTLYTKLHPNNKHHDYEKRVAQLAVLRRIGYQVGTGVMIGLPFQKIEDLADDLLFFKKHGIDMIGMGPYIEHEDTPLYQFKNDLLSKSERFDLSLKMVAILRLICPDVNIAATTAMQTLDPQGREKAIMVGANVIMPNLTPVKYREGYQLYEDKPCMDEEASECMNCLEARLHMAGAEIGYGEKGDAVHFTKRNSSKVQ
jgi:biotin synthase